ncbi:MAG: iniA [Modestobacter sp.]|nr:iniA [Modestobacter sp.]
MTTGPAGRHRPVGGRGGGSELLDDVRALLAAAAVVHRDRPEAVARLGAQRRRLDEPLRVALTGRVKAGKSTLLNALVGERLAPTDAGECTRVVTWFRNGPTPQAVLHRVDGARRSLPVRRVGGGLQLDLAGTPPQDVARLVVDWPSSGLQPATLIDTPGIASLSADASARTQAFIEDDGQLSGADAVVFLTRQVQPADLAFLAAFQEATGGAGLHTTTITVLSRADELGSGRLDAYLAVEDVARRTAELPAVAALSQTVLPVAGLVAFGGRTLRHADFVALATLAQAERADVEDVLLSADRFGRPDVPVPLSRATRASLLERLGLFGIRLAVGLIRTGVAGTAPALADALVARSGLAELQRLLAVQFTERSAALKAGAALRLLEDLLRDQPVPGDDALWRELERVRCGSSDLVELDLLGRSRAPGGPFPAEVRAEAERLLGGAGAGPAARLGLPEETAAEELRAAAAGAVTRWRAWSADPLTPRAAVDAAEVVVRSCEELLGVLDAGVPDAGVPGSALPAGPAPRRSGQHESQEAGHHQRALTEEGDPGHRHRAVDQALVHVDRQQGQPARHRQGPPRPGPAA